MGLNEIIKIGDNIKKYRKEKLKITQEKMAEKVGLKRSTYANYENNTREPDLKTINKIAQTLGVAINQLVGNKRTMTQNVLDSLLSDGLTLEKISKDSEIPIMELNKMYTNSADITYESIQKLGSLIDATNEQISNWIANDTFINSTYNNDGSHPGAEIMRKFFLGESLSLEDILANIDDEDKEFITHLYNAGLLDRTNKSKKNLISKNSDINNPDFFKPIEYFIKFLRSDKYPVDKLNNVALSYLYEKVTDTLEFEFYKLDKSDYKIPADEKE